jgi:hypothetical protein
VGFFKDLKRLKDTSKEIQANHDVQGAIADAQRQMAAATAAMEAAAGSGDLADRGEHATAQVLAARASGMLVNHAPMLEVDLMVFREGKPPYPATTSMSSSAGIPAQGQQVEVLVDPEDPYRVVIG